MALIFGLAVAIILLVGVFCREINGALQTDQPNIVIILADDLGYNDVSWQNKNVHMSNLQKLASEGIVLKNSYMQSTCTPSRAALLTGLYPIHSGRQWPGIKPHEPSGLYTNLKLLPEYLDKLGYVSHIVGKWHLGFCSEEYLPTSRGFSSFYGFRCGSQDYFSHRNHGGGWFDFWRGDEPDWKAEGTYSAELFGREAQIVVKNHADHHPDQPFFLYLAFQSVHGPLQVPSRFEDPSEENSARRIFLGMASAMDEAVGNLTKALEEEGLLQNTIIVFSSDNGGQVHNGGSNFPLRGAKYTLWEGGHKVPAFIRAPFFPDSKKGSSYHGLFHVTDWLPTLYTAAGGNGSSLSSSYNLDGVDQWGSMLATRGEATAAASYPRTEMLYNIEPRPPPHLPPKNRYRAAIRVGDLKLIVGDPGLPVEVVGEGGAMGETEADPAQSKATRMYVEEMQGEWNRRYDDSKLDGSVLLFDLERDPSEEENLAKERPNDVKSLLGRLANYERTMVPAHKVPSLDKRQHPLSRDMGTGKKVAMAGWCMAERGPDRDGSK